LQSEQRSSHRRSEGASNDDREVTDEGDADEEDGDEDSGHSQVLQASDSSDGEETVDVVTEEENDEDNKEDEANDEVWMNEKRHSGDGEVMLWSCQNP